MILFNLVKNHQTKALFFVQKGKYLKRDIIPLDNVSQLRYNITMSYERGKQQ